MKPACPNRWLLTLCAGLAALAPAVAGATTVSYVASAGMPGPAFSKFDGNVPFFGYTAPESVASGTYYEMGPTDQGKYTFWYTDDLILDHTKTVEIAARVKVVSESSINDTDRAGFAIALTDDRNYYNELYFHTDEIFLNKRGDTTRVRDVAYSMNTTGFNDYLMRLEGDTISVFVNGGAVPVLAGSIFSLAGLDALPTAANWAVIGDVTGAASSTWQMESFSVSVVPEPAAGAVLIVASLLTLGRRRRRAQFRLCPDRLSA